MGKAAPLPPSSTNKLEFKLSTPPLRERINYNLVSNLVFININVIIDSDAIHVRKVNPKK